MPSLTGLLKQQRSTQTFFCGFLATNHLQCPSSESATFSPLEQAVTMTTKEAHMNETLKTPGKGGCQRSKNHSVLLQHINMGVPEIFKTLSAQNQVCSYKSRHKHCSMVLFRLHLSYQTSWNTDIHSWQCRKQLLIDNTSDYLYCFTTEYKYTWNTASRWKLCQWKCLLTPNCFMYNHDFHSTLSYFE